MTVTEHCGKCGARVRIEGRMVPILVPICEEELRMLKLEKAAQDRIVDAAESLYLHMVRDVSMSREVIEAMVRLGVELEAWQ